MIKNYDNTLSEIFSIIKDHSFIINELKGVTLVKDTDVIMDVIDKLPIKKKILKTFTNHKRDSAYNIFFKDNYFLLYKCSNPSDPGIILIIVKEEPQLKKVIKMLNFPEEMKTIF